MVAHAKQAEAMAFIRECILSHGDQHGPAVARARYTDIAQPTWWRWCRAVKDEIEVAHGAASAPQSGTTFGEPSPATVSPLDFFEGQLGEALRDIELLRQQAVVRDASGTIRLRNPMLMTQAVRLRNQMLGLFVQRQESAIGTERAMQFQELIVGAIENALRDCSDPAEKAVARRVFSALRQAEKQWKDALHIVDPRRAAAAMDELAPQSSAATVQ